MSMWYYGPEHDWFAWRPVWTDTGFKWLKTLKRRRVYIGDYSPGAAGRWECWDEKNE